MSTTAISELNKTGHFANGFISSVFMIGVTQPLFTVKTYWMNGLKTPDVSIFYRGIVPNALSAGLAEGVVFLTQEVATRNFVNFPMNSTTKEFTISSIAGIIGAPINSACERVMIHQQLKVLPLMDTMKALGRREGYIRSLLKGVCPTAVRDALYNIGVFALNDQIQEIFKNVTGQESILVSGFVSGGLVGFLSAPFDRIKTIIQSDMDDKFTKTSQTALHILKTKGIKGFFLGAGARVVLVGTAICTMCIAKEKIPDFLPKNCY